MKKRIVIFGATGGTGQELVKQALSEGHLVTAFAKTPKKLQISHPNLSIVRGNVLNDGDVFNALDRQDVVFCNLGIPASEKSTLRAEGTSNIVKAMEAKGIKRFICQASLGYGDSKAVLPWHMKYLIVPFILKNAFHDHALQEAVIENSTLDWTIVRPGNLTNGKKTERYKHGFVPTEKIKLKVSRADVAHFMLRQASEPSYLHKKVGISY